MSEQFIGIMQLDTRFPRPAGDIGHPDSYDFPVRIKMVDGANVDRVVVEGDPALLEPFMAAALELEAEGAIAITTSCGFLAPFQNKIAQALNIPVFMSSLIQIPLVHRMTPGRIGIITANGTSLKARHFWGAGVPDSIPMAICGLHDKPSFKRTIFDDEDYIDMPLIEQEVLEAANELLEKHPDISAFVFECHNLAPYGAAVQKATGRPVYDIIAFAHWIYSTLVKREYPLVQVNSDQ